jgi:hypothetical protein
MSRPASAALDGPSPTATKAIAAIVGAVSLGILVEADHD